MRIEVKKSVIYDGKPSTFSWKEKGALAKTYLKEISKWTDVVKTLREGKFINLP
jgi:hypothetical protein